jgi:NADPH:quinone reductase-like Zn-dependent oxidoreductase
MSLSNRGIVKIAQGRAHLTTIPVPNLPDDGVLVRTVAVALNPTDWQTLDEKPRPNFTYSLLGCDASGIVVEVGKNVTKNFKKGDRIAGMGHGGKLLPFLKNISANLIINPGNDLHPEYGCFAEYILVKGDISLHIPPQMSFEEAATLGCGIGTIALGLYKYLELPMLSLPLEEEEKADGQFILIYGGSSATGTLAIQFAKL